MATVTFSTLLPEVLPFVADCPALLAEHAICNAAIEFCHKTQLWTYDVAPANIVADTASYTPVVPAETVLVEILQVWRETVLLPGRTADELWAFYRTDWREKSGQPLFHYRNVPTIITLVPNPDTAITDGLEMRVALSPSRAGTLVDSEIAERYAELIGLGARARLQAVAGQPFFSPENAAKNERKFLRGITDARIKANRSLTRGQSGVRFNGGFL